MYQEIPTLFGRLFWNTREKLVIIYRWRYLVPIIWNISRVKYNQTSRTSAAISPGGVSWQTDIYLIRRLAFLTNSVTYALLGGWIPPDWQSCFCSLGAVTVIVGEVAIFGSVWLEEDSVLDVAPDSINFGVICLVNMWFPGSSSPPVISKLAKKDWKWQWKIILCTNQFTRNFVIVIIFFYKIRQIFQFFQREHFVLHGIGDGLWYSLGFWFDGELIWPLRCEFNWTWTNIC